MAGAIHSNNLQLFEQLLPPFEKKNLPVRTAEVFNLEFKTIQPFEQQRFSVRQSDSAFRGALNLLSHSCHRAPFFVCIIYFKGIALQMSIYL